MDRFILLVLSVVIVAFVIKETKHYTWKQTQQAHHNLEFGNKP